MELHLNGTKGWIAGVRYAPVEKHYLGNDVFQTETPLEYVG